MLRHQTPVHGREPIFLFLPFAVAKRVADANGKLVAVLRATNVVFRELTIA